MSDTEFPKTTEYIPLVQAEAPGWVSIGNEMGEIVLVHRTDIDGLIESLKKVKETA